SGSTMRRLRPSKLRPRRLRMRLAILDNGHGFGTKALFAFIRAVSRQPVPDVLKVMRYPADFFRAPMQRVTHQARRRPAAWALGMVGRGPRADGRVRVEDQRV